MRFKCIGVEQASYEVVLGYGDLGLCNLVRRAAEVDEHVALDFRHADAAEGIRCGEVFHGAACQRT